MRYAWYAVSAAILSSGCTSSYEPPAAAITLLAGPEMDTWDSTPTGSKLEASLVPINTMPVSLATVGAPATSVGLPIQHYTAPVIARFALTATDPSGSISAWGSSIPLLVYDLSDFILPIYVARAGAFSRLPGTLAKAHLRPVTVVEAHENLIVAGGDAVPNGDPAVPDIYDEGRWLAQKPTSGQPSLPRVPKSMALTAVADSDGMLHSMLLLVDDTAATWLDLSVTPEKSADAPAPTGLTFAEIAGGETFILNDGTRYIIGGTRSSGTPTDKVLKIDPTNGSFTALTLTTPRVAAAAGLVNGNLVIAGGNASDAWAEVFKPKDDKAMPPTLDHFEALPVMGTATAGTGIGGLDGTIAIVAGGKDMAGAAASVRTFDSACTVSCTTSDLATLPISLVRTKVFPLTDPKGTPTKMVLVEGEADDGQNHAFVVDTGMTPPTVTEQPLREPRIGATPVLLPSSQPGLVGGTLVDSGAPALSVEAFF